jgi:hypothetical protein
MEYPARELQFEFCKPDVASRLMVTTEGASIIKDLHGRLKRTYGTGIYRQNSRAKCCLLNHTGALLKSRECSRLGWNVLKWRAHKKPQRIYNVTAVCTYGRNYLNTWKTTKNIAVTTALHNGDKKELKIRARKHWSYKELMLCNKGQRY